MQEATWDVRLLVAVPVTTGYGATMPCYQGIVAGRVLWPCALRVGDNVSGTPERRSGPYMSGDFGA